MGGKTLFEIKNVWIVMLMQNPENIVIGVHVLECQKII